MSDLAAMSKRELIPALHSAIDREPVGKQPTLCKIAFLLSDISNSLTEIRRGVCDCNVILARTVDRLVRFEATENGLEGSRV